MIRLFSLVACLFTTAILTAQVVTTDPIFPTVDDTVTITFDASQGNGALAGFEGTVYAHTGVITTESTSPSDWRYVKTDWAVDDPAVEMTRVGPDLYQITYQIQNYYGIPDEEKDDVLEMSFVFRNLDGAIVGRAEDGSDIFTPVFSQGSDLLTTLLQPNDEQLLTQAGDSITVRAAASKVADLRLEDNGELITAIEGRELNIRFPVGEAGNHLVTFTADDGSSVRTESFQYFVVREDLAAVDPPEDLLPGINRVGDTSVVLRLDAPGKENVFVIGSFNDWQLDSGYRMRQATNDTTFWLPINGLSPDSMYIFQYLVDGDLKIADPFSELVLDPVHDGEIGPDLWPGLPDYPSDKTSGIATLLRPRGSQYVWRTQDYQRPPEEELVIYELLVRDFLADHSYQSLIDTLDYLDRLGINAIQLMPVNEFEGNLSWGYNPSFHMAVDKYYGTPEDLKMLVDSAHARGMAVILDVVYNHAFSQSPFAQLYWDAANFRPASNNPYLNPVPRHPFNVGSDFNHESALTRQFVERVMQYWLEEFRVDGFRFDLSKGFTQTNSGDNVGQWNQFDASRVDIIQHYADVVWETTPGAYVTLEHLANNDEEMVLADYGMLLWGGFGPHDEYLEAAMGYDSDIRLASYQFRGWDAPRLIPYMESHDEQRMLYKNLQFGNSSGDYDVRELETALQRAELAAAFFYTIPGPKLLWQFGELGYDFPINYCPNGSVDPGCRTDLKPIRWDYFEDPNRRRLYNRVASLIYLKTNFEAFNTANFSLNDANTRAKSIHLMHETMDVAVQGNFDVEEQSIANPFPRAGMWYEYFTGDSLMVQNPDAPLTFVPGEYRLYTTAPIERPEALVTSVREELAPADAFRMQISPNPSGGAFQLSYDLSGAGQVRVELFNSLGQRLRQWSPGRQGAGDYTLPVNIKLEPGMYVVKLTVGREVQARKLLVNR